MAELQLNALKNQKTLIHVPCKSKLITQEIKSDDNSYILELDGTVYYNTKLECVFGADKNNTNLINNKYSKLILKNNDIMKNLNSPILIEFYAKPDVYLNSNNNFFKINFLSLNDNKKRILNFSLVDINLCDNNGAVEQNILEQFDAYKTPGYYFIQIDPNNGKLEVFINGSLHHSGFYTELQNIIIEQIEFYLGMITTKKVQKQTSINDGQYRNNTLIYKFEDVVHIQHNIYYNNFKISTGNYDKSDIINRLKYVKYQKFINISTIDLNRIIFDSDNKYIDGSEIVNIVANPISNVNLIKDTGMIDHEINNPNENLDKNESPIIQVYKKFNQYPQDTSLYIRYPDTSIVSESKNNFSLITDFTINMNLILTGNLINNSHRSIFSIYGKNEINDNEQDKIIIKTLVYYYQGYCELYFSFFNPKNGKLIDEYFYKTYYDYINRISIIKNQQNLSITINNKTIFTIRLDDVLSSFYYTKTIIGKNNDYQNFIGYFSNFTLLNKAKYLNQESEGLNLTYNNPKIKLFSIYQTNDLIKQKNVKNTFFNAPVPDNNYLIYTDFVNNKIESRAKNTQVEFDYDFNPVFVSKEFPGDSYSQALITSSKSKLTIKNPSKINLADLTNFTIEMDFKFIVNPFLCNNLIKLFSNDTLKTYLTVEDGYLVFYIGNKYGQQIKMKYYYPIESGVIIHIALQKIKNLFYLIINDTVVFVNSISNLSQFFIEDVYINQSSLDIMYINRFSVSKIARYDIQLLKKYPMDAQSLIYLPYESQTNFTNNKFPQSEENNYSVFITDPSYNNSYFKEGYGAISSGSTLYFTLPNKYYDSGNISLYFWNKMVTTENNVSDLNCTLLKLRSDSFSSKDSDIYELDLRVTNNYTLTLKSSIINPNGDIKNTSKTESLGVNIINYTRGMFNTWNSFAFTYDVKTYTFTLFINGNIIYSGILNYFKTNTINSLALFTSYKYNGNKSNGQMYLSSIRLSKGIYYTTNFHANTTGLLYKSDISNIKNIEETIKPEIIYTKYPKNELINAAKIQEKYEIKVATSINDCFTISSWMYISEDNSNTFDPVNIKFLQGNNVLCTLYLTQKSLEEVTVRLSDNIKYNTSEKVFPKKQWVHIACTYIKSSNQIKIWINGKLIIQGIYFGITPLTEISKITIFSGSNDAYISEFTLYPSLKYTIDSFIPLNSLQLPDDISGQKYQNIPQLIYKNHLNGNVNNSIPITNTGYVSNLINSNDTGHTIEFWLYTTKNERVKENPLRINIMAKNENNDFVSSIHEIILSRYLGSNTDDIHWNQNITVKQTSGIILTPNKWSHFALVYNKPQNSIKLFYNGKKILDSIFNKDISLKNLKQIIINTSTGVTYLEGFIQISQALYDTDFIPNNSMLSGMYLLEYSDNNDNINVEKIETRVISDHIGELDDHYITYLDFEDCSLKDKSKAQVEWKNFGILQYQTNQFSHDPNGNALLLKGSSGIYTNDTSLNFNSLHDFTIEMEIKNYSNYQNDIAGLFVNFLSWISLFFFNNTKISLDYHHLSSKINFSSSINLTKETYIAFQRKDNILSLYINGTLIKKYEGENTLRLDNFASLYLQNKSFDHIIDIGMSYNGIASNTHFFIGYINKVAISDVARFDDGGSTVVIANENKNDTTVFYHPVKLPDYNALYRTTPRSEPWFWRYRLKNSKVYPDKSVGYNNKWKNYVSIGPSREQKIGFIEYSNSNITHRSFTFEFWMQKDTTAETTIESKIISISNMLLINTGENGPVIWKHENNGNKTKLSELIIENGIFTNRWNHFAITFNYHTKTLQLFINGQLLFITTEFKNLIPSSIQLHTNTMILNPTYFSSIRYSKGIIYKENFNISLINKPFEDYEESDKIDFEKLPEYVNNNNTTSSSLIARNIDENVVFYLPFKNGKIDANAFLSPGIKTQFEFTTNNSSLYKR